MVSRRLRNVGRSSLIFIFTSELQNYFCDQQMGLRLNEPLLFFLLVDVDECASDANNCLSGTAACVNTVGSYNCTCNHGYTGDGKTSCLSQGKQYWYWK